MLTKHITRLVSLALLVLAPICSAQVSGELAAPFATAYTFRGTKLAGTSVQPSVSLALAEAYATVWHNQPVARERDSETDITAGYSVTWWATGIDVGLTAYTYPHAQSTYEPYVGLSRAIGGGLKATITTFRDVTLNATTLQASLSYSGPLSERATLSPRAAAGTVRHGYSYWEGGLDLSYAVSKAITSTIGVSYTSSNLAGSERGIVVATGGLRVRF